MFTSFMIFFCLFQPFLKYFLLLRALTVLCLLYYLWYIQENTVTCGFQLSAVKLGDLLKPLLLSRLVPQLPTHYNQHSLESVSLREKMKQCTIYNVALSQSDIGERPCILTSRSHCLHVYSHSVEQNTFYLPDCHKTHTYHLPLSTSQPLILNFLSLQTMFLLVVLF